MKKVMAVSLSLVLLLGTITGCHHKAPDEKETRERVEEIVCGEDFKLKGGDDGYYTAYSKDRDLEFEVWWAEDGNAILPDIKIPNGEYYIHSSYGKAVLHFWFDEYQRCIDQYGFYNVDYGPDADAGTETDIDSPYDSDYCCPSTVWIYMDEDSEPEDIEKVESLMRDLRDICEKEEEYHTSDYNMEYSVYLCYRVGVKEYKQSSYFKISKDSKDRELTVDNFEFSDRTTKSGPGRFGSGVAVITVYED